jgi:hypothetical protein
MEPLSRPTSTAAGGTDPTQAYENEPLASNKGKFHATSGLQRHFGRGKWSQRRTQGVYPRSLGAGLAAVMMRLIETDCDDAT